MNRELGGLNPLTPVNSNPDNDDDEDVDEDDDKNVMMTTVALHSNLLHCTVLLCLAFSVCLILRALCVYLEHLILDHGFMWKDIVNSLLDHT